MTQQPFTPGAVYQHRRNQDVAMVVTKVQFHGTEYTKLRVRWWNLQLKALCTNSLDNVIVKRGDYDGWRRIEL